MNKIFDLLDALFFWDWMFHITKLWYQQTGSWATSLHCSVTRMPNCADFPHTNPLPDTPKPIRVPLWRGSILWNCVIPQQDMLSLFLKWLKEMFFFFFYFPQSCFRKQSSVWKLAFLCRRDSLIRNDCGNCAICSTLVTFNAPEKQGCCTGEW